MKLNIIFFAIRQGICKGSRQITAENFAGSCRFYLREAHSRKGSVIFTPSGGRTDLKWHRELCSWAGKGPKPPQFQRGILVTRLLSQTLLAAFMHCRAHPSQDPQPNTSYSVGTSYKGTLWVPKDNRNVTNAVSPHFLKFHNLGFIN